MEFVCDPKQGERNGSTFHSLCPMDSDALSDLPFHPLSFRVVLCAFRYHGPEGKRRNRCTHSASDFMLISYYIFSEKGRGKRVVGCWIKKQPCAPLNTLEYITHEYSMNQGKGSSGFSKVPLVPLANNVIDTNKICAK